MTKTKQIAAVAVSVVLAGTMAISITACKKDKSSNSYGDGVVNMALASGTTLNVAIGYNSNDTGFFYGSSVGSNQKFVGGYTANAGAAKPAAQAFMDALGIKFVDKYGGKSTSANLDDLVSTGDWGKNVDIATSDLSKAVSEATNNTVLNLADYLQYMPNFEAFLKENPVVYLSLLQDGMDTSNGSGEKIYVAPYFDGMDDIEKGVLMRQDWVEKVLDENWSTNENYSSNNDTFATACYSIDENGKAVSSATATSAESYMGTTGSWSIESTAEPTNGGEADGTETVTITKNYDAALSALRSTSSSLYTAYMAIAGTAPAISGADALESGNIVDIMNAAITADFERASGAGEGATGENLASLYKAYIATAYTVDSGQYYGKGSVPYSKVFTGYSACWDVDDLVALLRIIKCSSGQVGLTSSDGKTIGIYPRSYDNDRTPDLVSLVGELYGCRGATSRYENTYIDSEGNLQDARNDVKFWDSLERFGGLAKEGLVDYRYVEGMDHVSMPSGTLNTLHGADGQKGTGFMQWDYSQTQTTHEFDRDDKMNYGWVNTPVSLWDDGTYNTETGEDDEGYSYKTTSKITTDTGKYTREETTFSTTTVGEKYMRFTDSWRSTKTAGLVVASDVAKDENKLAATLSFIDYLYSNDGQITGTYAIQSTNGDTNPNGTWYGEKVTEIDNEISDYLDETYQYVIKDEYSDKYVVYNGKITNKDGSVPTDDEGKEMDLDIETYAEKVSSYRVKEEYQSEYFAYKGELYKGTLYKGKMTPVVTSELYEHFISSTSAEALVYSSVTGSFTNFARYILGATLPMAVKDQSFENQLTAKIAQEDATRVSVSISNGTINHCDLTVREDNYFYTCVPTGLPLSDSDQRALDGSGYTDLMYMTGTAYNGNGFWSTFHHIIWFGYTGTYDQNNETIVFGAGSGITDAETMIAYLNGYGLANRLYTLGLAWGTAKEYWDYLKA